MNLTPPKTEKASAGRVHVVRDNQSRAVVVTASKPTPVAVYAAQELVDHIERATGQRLAIVTEASIPAGYDSHIFVGDTDAARGQRIDIDALGVEECVLRTFGSDLFILGKELHPDEYKGIRRQAEPWNPLSPECAHSGTLFGVYDVLQQYVGVRWLWPGELGTYVPRSDTLEIPELNETSRPKLFYRDLGDWNPMERGMTGVRYGNEIPVNMQGSRLTEELLRRLVFPTERAGREYGKAMEQYMRRHRRFTPIENVRIPIATHVIAGLEDWWAEYGKEHPEWFGMRSDGQRGREVPRDGAYTAMCVSNEELHREIIRLWNAGDVLALGEADVGGDSYCQCDKCKSWDDPQPTDFPEIMGSYKYLPRVVTGRYARYWKTVHDLAVKRNPNVRVVAYLYHNALPAPAGGTMLSKNIVGEFVIYGGYDGWYPMTAEEDQWYRDTWQAWANAGISLIFGPNHLLNNYVTPNVTTWQTGEFIRFAGQNGMVGANFRSFSFSWAVHGPMAYMHFRLLADPELKIGAIRQEYFSAFGPAATLIEEYFDYWENYSRTRPAVGTIENGDKYGAIEKLRRVHGHYLAYPPAVFVPAKEILRKARTIAQQHPLSEYAERVEFLQAGLEHALLALKIHDFIDYESPAAEIGAAPTDPERLKQARQAMKELIKFRHDPKNLFVADFISNATVEQSYIRNIESLIEGRMKSGDYVSPDEIY